MANKPKRMDQIRQIISVYNKTGSLKRTAQQTKISRNTVRSYVRKIEALGLNADLIGAMSDEELSSHLYEQQSFEQEKRHRLFRDQVDDWIKELRKVGVTRQLLWEEYKCKQPKGFEYSQFCERLKKEVQRRDLTLSLDHTPAEAVMVDFTGSKFPWINKQTGEVIYCEVLIAVLPHSQYTYAVAVSSQRIEDFISAINLVFLFLGGLPKVLLSDNLKSYVTRANRYEPKFTQLCEQLAAHYAIDIQATRPRKPRDKASVENAVSNAYRRIYAPLRHEQFYSEKEINIAFEEQLKILNNRSYQKKSGSRQSIFDTYEKELLRPIPADLFEIKKLTKAKVQKNYHIVLGETNNYYSVHYQYVGQTVEVMYTSSYVEIYLKGQRIAFHARLQNLDGHRYQTHSDHMPQSHQEWLKVQGYKAADFIRQADHIGPNTKWAIEFVLRSKIHEEQTYKSCLGIIRLASHYSTNRLEAACLRCKEKANTVSYTMLNNILIKKMEGLPNDSSDINEPLPSHDNIRGRSAYA